MACPGSRSLRGWAGLEPGPPSHSPLLSPRELKTIWQIYLSVQWQWCTAAITWHLNFDDTKGSSFWNVWTRQVTNSLQWWGKGISRYPLLAAGSAGALYLPITACSWLRLLELREACLTCTLAALTDPSRGALSCPRSARWQPTSFPTSGQVLVLLLPICHIGQVSLIAKWLQALPRKAERAAS